jgi:hypothetical protein
MASNIKIIYNGSDNESDNNESGNEPTIPSNLGLAIKFQRARRFLPFSTYSGNKQRISKNIVKSIIAFNFSWIEMRHLATPEFVQYIIFNNIELAKKLQELMYAIFICNDAIIDWYRYYEPDVFTYMSIFLGEEYSSYPPRPPYVECIGSLDEPYFYNNWIKYYNIYSRLSWIIYTEAVVKKQKKSMELNTFCKKKAMPFSYKDALIKDALVKDNKKKCIQLIFSPKFLLTNKIAAFLGEGIIFQN